MTSWLRRMVTARRVVVAVATVAVAAVLASLVGPVQFPVRAPNPGIMAPGSQGSLPQYPWWDPHGWFAHRAPGSTVLAGTAKALPSRGRDLRQVKAPPVRRVRELVAKRSEYGKVYQLSDGRQQAVISGAPVNYQDPAGRWRPISTTVTRSRRQGFALQNVTNTYRSFFGSQPEQLVRFEVPGGGWLSIGVAGARPVALRAAGDVVTYPGLAPGEALSYAVTRTSLQERITLASAAAARSPLTFTVRAGGGLVPYQQRGGSIAWSRGGGPVLVMPAPLMTDSGKDPASPLGAGWSAKVAQHATWDAATGTLQLTLTPDAAWLNRPGRVFPVVIDPTIEIAPTPSQAQNVMISSDSPSTNFSSSWQLSAGTTSTGAARTLISFPLTTIPAGTQIDSADLMLYYDQVFGPGTASQAVEADQATSSWSASTATWANASNNVGQQGVNEVVVDDSATSGTSASGAWPSQPDSSAVNGEYLYDQDTVSGDTFTWVPQITESGNYYVADHYVASTSAASNAPFTVNYNGGTANYTVNQQSGAGGQWAVMGHLPFAAGTAGSVVLGDGPASSSVRVEADAVRFRKWASVTVNPNVANLWDSFSVRNIVQGWLNGTSPNYGFVVKASDETTMNVGGPRYEASGSFYSGETATYPQLVVTYGRPAVTLNPITTITATGADLSWAPYVDPTPGTNPGDDLAEYQVYRSVDQSFTPDASTLVSPVQAGTTSFNDTSAPPTPAGSTSANAFYYMVAVKTADGQIIPGPTKLAQLPVAGHTVQIINASGTATLSQAQPATNEQTLAGQLLTAAGDNSSAFGVTRTVAGFPSLASQIPAGATITDARLRLWGWSNINTGGGPATYEAHQLTQSFDPATVTWNNASSATAWTTTGGTYDPTVASTVTGLTNNPGRLEWPVTAIAQGWLSNPASQYGLLLKLSSETSTSPQEQELFLNTSAAEPALRPELVVTYLTTTAGDTYYAPDLPHVMASAGSYTTSVTVTNTTASTWKAADWVLTYHWLLPDGTDVTTSSNQAQTPLPNDLAPGAQATITAAMTTPDTTGSGSARTGYELAWDLYNKTAGTWLSSGTSTPNYAGTSTAPGTVGPLDQVTSVTRSASDLLGLEKYYQYTGVNTGSGSALLNNDDTGNVVWSYNAFSHPSQGFATFVRLAYNSMDTSDSSMGFGWSLQTSTLMRLGTPLDFHPPGNPNTVTLTDGDGTSHEFTLSSDGSTWTSPPGFHYYLQKLVTCDPNRKSGSARAWLLTAPDRTQFYYDCQGYQTAIIDKNGNEADFTYTNSKSNNQPVKFLDYITDQTGRQTLTISYYRQGDSSWSYFDPTTGKVVPGTGKLTNPKIIDQVKSITDIAGRTITFVYTTQGLMAQMTDGDGSGLAKVFTFGYDMTQGNKNVKLVSVTDPRNNTTQLAYYKAPQDPKFKWSLQTITDRLSNPPTSFAYTEPAPAPAPPNAVLQTVVTDPKNNATTYLMDSTGRPIQVTNAKTQVTKLAWDADNNVTSLTEDNGAQTTWTWDQNTGYPKTMTDAQANHDGTAGYTYGYQFGLSGHTADLTSLQTPQQRLWTFGYYPNGNLQTVTKPLGNVTGAAAGSYTTTYQYYANGNLHTAKDPDGNITTYSNYDPTGYPQTITDALGNPTNYVYSPAGDVTSVTDALNHTTSQQYDIFGRPGQLTVQKTSTVNIVTPAPVYDGNDNITQTTTPDGAVTTYTYNADDELTKKVTPPDTPNSLSPTTTYGYDPNGNLTSVTEPDGNGLIPPGSPPTYTTNYGYDAINELTSVTDALNNLTQYGYNDVGDRTSVTDPLNNQTQYFYNLNHQLTKTQDAAGSTTKIGYDLDGLVQSTTDQNNNTTQYTLDQDGQVVQAQVPAQAPGQPVSYDTTQYVYDQVGNRTQVLTPRAVAAGFSTTSSCVASQTCPYTWVTQYDADNRVSAQLSAYNPSDPVYNTPATTSYGYDAAGRLTSVTAPPSGNPPPGDPAVPNITNYTYFDNGWVKSSTDPWGIATSYKYNNLGEQSARTITSAGGDMSRTMTWGYYPDGKLEFLNDDGVPTGLSAELADNSDANNATWTGTWPRSTSGTGYLGYNYQTHAAGAGTDKFTWHLNIPQDGNYTVYVAYPAVSGAATNASYKVTYSTGSATATVNQTQNTSPDANGKTVWVQLGKWAFTASGTGQQVTLSQNSGGTVAADAVKAVRDITGVNNTAHHAFSYTYDLSGNLTGIADNSTTNPAIASYAMTYDQDNRITKVEEDNSGGTAVHTTNYTYDAASNLHSRTHDGAPSTYTYNNLNQLSQESDATSSTDTSPQVSNFTYTPTGQLYTETKPNDNKVTGTYYANGQLYTQTENTAGGTLVASHTYQYDPNGNKTQDKQKLMNADNSSAYLSHTLGYSYDPMDRLTQVTTDGATTESYTHDPNSNVIAQTINNTSTSYTYDRNRLLSATTGGTITDYNYDPLGRLDTITSGGSILECNTYDGFDQIIAHGQNTACNNTANITTYTYDPLNRLTSQTPPGGTTTNFAYLGLSPDLVSESKGGTVTKTYTYTPGGLRLSQVIHNADNTTTPGYYTYNDHSDVEALTGATGNTTATYGYTAYGQPIASQFTGKDKSNANPSPTSQPYNLYRFNAMRWDSTSGQYDMGFRNYGPALNQFLTRDMYNGALADMQLVTDPFTGDRYTFAAGNPTSNIELDGHMFPAGGGSPCTATTPGCPGYHPASTTSGSSSGGGCSWLSCVGHWLSTGANWLGTQGTNVLGGIVNGVNDTANFLGTGYRWIGAQLRDSFPTGVTSSGQLTFNPHAGDAIMNPPRSPFNIGNRNTIAYKVGYYGWPLLFPPAGAEDESVALDSSAARALASADRSVAGRLIAQIGGRQMVMSQTAANEFQNAVARLAGPTEKGFADNLMGQVQVVADNPSARALALQLTGRVGANDIQIFGTADQMGIPIFTSDASFLRGAAAQGVEFNAIVHPPMSFIGH